LASDSPPSVAIVILNFNGRGYLQKFLPSVVQYSKAYTILVADNGSTDGSLAMVEAHFPEVGILPLGQNLGFCQGYNTALRQVEADYYVLLNSDVEVTPQWLAPLIRYLEQNPSVGAVQPKIRSYEWRHCLEYAGAGGGFLDRWGYPFCRGRVFESIEEDRGQYDDVRPVFWATGACLAVRAEVYWELGGLDEDFFAHMEEIDLCWRMQNAGYQVCYFGQSHVFHVGGGTLHKSNPRKTYFNFRNCLSLLYKNLPDNELSYTLGVRLLLDGVAAVRMFLQGDWADAKAVWDAHRYFFRNKGYLAEKRKAAGPKKSFRGLCGFYPKSIVWQHFILKRKRFSELEVPDGAPLPA
jgi:GT2 family glycosyltransferase